MKTSDQISSMWRVKVRLAEKGYTARMNDDGDVVVQDPIHMCASNGICRIVGHKTVVLTTPEQASKFLLARE